jgi:hypothetical protein
MFCCSSCKYKTCIKYNMKKHIINVHKRDVYANEIIKKEVYIDNEQKSGYEEQKSGYVEQKLGFLEQKSGFLEQKSGILEQKSVCFNEKILSCQNCQKIFKSFRGLQKHKNTCKGVENILQCHFCKKMFSSKQTKSEHIKICKIKDAKEQIQQTSLATSNNSTNTTNNTTNNMNNTNNNTNNQQIIYQINNYRVSNDNYKNKYDNDLDNEDIEHINDFGLENISYITDEQMHQFAIDHNFKKLIMEKHFNEEHPENHNIRNNCKKSFKVLKNKRWLPELKDVVFSVIYNNTRSQLFDFAYRYIFPNLDEEKKEEYLSVVQKYDKQFKQNAYKTIDLHVQELMKSRRDKMISNQTQSQSLQALALET